MKIGMEIGIKIRKTVFNPGVSIFSNDSPTSTAKPKEEQVLKLKKLLRELEKIRAGTLSS